MPSRIIREGILTSERVDQLKPEEEVFYRRLLSKVDDHGLYDARLSILRASLFPLRLDRVREADISRWMAACQKAGLIALYENGGKPYLIAYDTKWEKRSAPKFPLPPENACEQLKTTGNTSTVVVDVVEDVVVKSPNGDLSGKPDVSPLKVAEEVLEYLNKAASRAFEFRTPGGKLTANADVILKRLQDGYSGEQLREVVLLKAEQWKGNDKMAEYLRPETLFNRTKFSQYIGELANG